MEAYKDYLVLLRDGLGKEIKGKQGSLSKLQDIVKVHFRSCKLVYEANDS